MTEPGEREDESEILIMRTRCNNAMRVARAMSRAQPASQVSAAAALVHEWHTNGIIMQEAGIAMTKQCDESGEEKGRQSSWLV